MDVPDSDPANSNNSNSNNRSEVKKNNNNNAAAADITMGDKADKSRARRRRFIGCLVFTTACIAGTCLSVILFLIPFVIDPAISALRSEITKASSGCRVSSARLGVGLSQCKWTSCLEGCTRLLFKCFQIRVTVDDDDWWQRIRHMRWLAMQEEGGSGGIKGLFSRKEEHKDPDVLYDGSVSDGDLSAVLLVNTRGCGYPPKVSCENFYRSYGVSNLTFPCYYSRQDPTVALPDFDPGQEERMLWLSSIPFIVLVVVLVILCGAIRVMRKMDKEDADRESLFGDDLDATSIGSGPMSPRETPPPSIAASRAASPFPPLPSPATKSRTLMAELYENMSHVTTRRRTRHHDEDGFEGGGGGGSGGGGAHQMPTFMKRIRH